MKKRAGTLVFAIALAAVVSGCSASAENPLAPDTSKLDPGAASTALSRTLSSPVLPGDTDGGEIQPFGYAVGWP